MTSMTNQTSPRRAPVTRTSGKAHPVIKSWLLAREADKLAPKSLLVYRAAVLSLEDFLTYELKDEDGEPAPAVALLKADRAHVRKWLIARREQLAPATMRVHFSAVRQFFNWVIQEGDEGLVRNPTENIPVPTISDDIPTPTLDENQCKALLAVPGKSFLARRDAALFYVMLDGGLRREEVCRLTVDDIDVDSGRVTVDGKGANRASRTRTVQLGIASRQAVDRYLRARSKRPYADQHQALWLSSWGDGALTHSGFQDIFKRHGKRIGVESFHPHMLRHTWASQFRSAGGEEGNLLVLGGWSSRAMLDRYGKADAAQRAREAYKKISVTDRLR
jgi:site-specific recombinase XerC